MPIDAMTSLLSSFASLPHVWAYLDPGSGSMMLQILLASTLSSAFFLKSWIRQVREVLLVRNKKA
jgi:tRNA1(Val) A37 N6-methylase TrmN6